LNTRQPLRFLLTLCLVFAMLMVPAAATGEDETTTPAAALTLGQFVEAVEAAEGRYDGNGVTVVIEPTSGKSDGTAECTVPERLQAYNGTYYAQYQRFAALGGKECRISNVNFVFKPAAITMTGAWNTSEVTTTAENIQGELQINSTGAVKFTNCTFDLVAVSPIKASAVSFGGCQFTGLDGYAIKDISATSSVNVSGCIFTDCDGGFWLNQAPATLTVENNTFAQLGGRGGIQFSANGDYTNTAMTVTGNEATGGGFLRQLNKTVSFEQVTAILENNTYETALVSGSAMPLAGHGTETDPYVISSLEDLKFFRDAVNADVAKYNAPGVYVVLDADINLSDVEWTPIGTGTRSGNAYSGNAFKGTFDGQGKSITGLSAPAGLTGSDAFGLFGIVDGGTVKNLAFYDVAITTDSKNVGTAIGLMFNGATAENITVESGSVTAPDGVGGVVGRMVIDGTISGCSNNASVTANTGAGGIVGKAYYTAADSEMTITDCTNTGAVTGGYAAGGITSLSAANVSDCSNTGIITAGTEAGGIIGEQVNYGAVTGNTNSGMVTNGETTGTAYGGIIGWIRYQTSVADYPVSEVIVVSGNTNSGNIDGEGSSLGTGGIVGLIYNQGTVTGNKNTAASIKGGVFTAGIAGGLQGTDGNLAIEGATITVASNISTTGIDAITATGTCKDLFAYNNAPGTFVVKNNGSSAVAKIGDVEYATLQGAIEAAKEGDTITLLSDIEQADGITITDKKLTIDLKGKTFTVTEGASTNNRNFKINGASVITIQNGTMVAAGDYSTGAYGTVRTEDTAQVTLTDLKLYNYRGNGLNIKALGGTTVNISDTEIYSQYGGGIEAAGATIELTNVTVDQKGMYTAPYNSMAISVNGGGKVTVNSGTYTTVPLTAEDANNQGTSHGSWVIGVLNSGGTLIVKDGTFANGNFGEDSLAAYARGAVLADTAAKVEIKGGTFNALDKIVDIQNNLGDAANNPVVTISGGNFNAEPMQGNTSNCIKLADNCEVVANEDGTYTVKKLPVAKIGETEFTDLAKAAAAAQSGDTIVLLTDVAESISAPAGITLKLNGKSINGTVTALGDLTILDSGSIVALKSTAGGTITVEEGKTLALSSFSFGSKDTSSAKYTITGGTITANYGFFQHGTYALHSDFETGYMYYSYGSDITVYGTFHSQGKGDGLDYVRGKLTIADGGQSIHDKALWVGQPESWGAMNATLIVDKGGYVQANTLNVYAGSELNVNDGTVKVIGTLTNNGNITIDAAGLTGSKKVIEQTSETAASLEGKVTIENAENVIVSYEDGDVIITAVVATVGDKSYATLQAAIDAADKGDIIELLTNVELTAPLTVPADKEITLNLNCKTISYTSTVQGEAMITNKGTLTINDTPLGNATGEIYYNYIGAADPNYTKGNYTISNGGTLTVNGGKIHIANLGSHAKYPIDNNSTTGNAVLVINGGHLYNYNTSAIRQFCNSTTYKNSVTINGGLIEGYSAIWMQNPGKNTVNGSLTINGGEIRTTAKAYVNCTATVGEVSSKIYATIDGEGGAWDKASALIITGGTFNENVDFSKEAPLAIVGDAAVFNGKALYIPAVAQGADGALYASLQAAIDAAAEGDTIVLLPGTISEGTIKLPATLKNVTIKAEQNLRTTLKDTTIMAYDGNTFSYEGITIQGIEFYNSSIVVTGWRTNGISLKDWTIMDCSFHHIVRSTDGSDKNLAALHFNLDLDEAMNGFTFINNSIDTITGHQPSGVYMAATGNVSFGGNKINNVPFRPIVLQINDCDGVTDRISISDNSFTSSPNGRLQVYGSESGTAETGWVPVGTDDLTLMITNNIFTGTTNTQYICTWGINPNNGFVQISHNYYDLPLETNPTKIYWNNVKPTDVPGLIELGVYPVYTRLNSDGTIDTTSEYTPDPYFIIGDDDYYTLQDAINAVDSKDDVIVMTRDEVILDSAFVVDGKDVTLDLGTYTLSVTSNKNLICSQGSLTIQNGTIDVSRVDLTEKTDCGIFAIGGAVTGHATAGHMTLDQIDVIGTDFGTGSNGAVFMLYTGGDEWGNSTLTINKSKLTLTNNNANGSVFYGTEVSPVSITDSKLIFDNVVRGAVECAITLNNCSVSITGGDNGFNGTALHAIGSDITITGGSGRGLTLDDAGMSIENSTVTISKMGEASIRFKDSQTLSITGTSAVTIDDIMVDDTVSAYTITVADTATLTGGVAAMTSTGAYYVTLADAINAAADGETVTLLSDVELTKNIVIPADAEVDFDLNGNTLTGCDDGKANWHAFIVEGKLTMDDTSAEQTGQIWSKCYGIQTKNNGVFVMNGGKIVATNNTTLGTPVVNYGGSVEINGGELVTSCWGVNAQGYFSAASVEINGGKFTIENSVKDYAALIVAGGSNDKNGTTVTINGGKFYGTNLLDLDTTYETSTLTVNGGEFAEDPSAYLANGLVAIKVNDMWVVSENLPTFAPIGNIIHDVDADNIQSLLNGDFNSIVPGGSINGYTIMLSEGMTLKAPLTIPAGVEIAIDLNGQIVSYASTTVGEDMITNYGTLTIFDSTEAKNGKITYCNTDTTGSNVTVSTISNVSGGNLTINSGIIENARPANICWNSDIYAFVLDNMTGTGSATATINGGTLTGNYRSIRQFANSDSKGNSLAITGGKIVGQVWLQSPNAKQNLAKLVIEGGSFCPTGNDGSSVYVTTASSSEISLSVTGGTFATKIGTDAPAKLAGAVTGGIFTETAKDNTSKALIAKNYQFVENADGTYTVTALTVETAPVVLNPDTENAKPFANLFDAVNEAAYHETSEILVKEQQFLTETLHINNKTIVLNGDVSGADKAIIVDPGATLILESGIIGGQRIGIDVQGTLIVNGGKIEGTTAVYLSGGAALEMTDGTIYASNIGIEAKGDAEASISGGAVYGNSFTIVADNTAAVTVSGGEFSQNLPINYLAEGYIYEVWNRTNTVYPFSYHDSDKSAMNVIREVIGATITDLTTGTIRYNLRMDFHADGAKIISHDREFENRLSSGFWRQSDAIIKLDDRVASKAGYDFIGWLDADGNLVTEYTVTGKETELITYTAKFVPTITSQPADATVYEGAQAKFSVTAALEGLNYQWQSFVDGKWHNTPIESNTTAKTPTFVTVPLVDMDFDTLQVRCMVSDNNGNVAYSDAATLTIVAKPAITQQPTDVSAANGETVTITLTASGADLTYEWYYKDFGASEFIRTYTFSGNTYSAVMNDYRNGRQVYCKVIDALGSSVTSNIVTLNMKETVKPAEILDVSYPDSVAAGEDFVITVTASGEDLTYEWFYKNTYETTFAKTGAFSGNTYSVQMNASRVGRQVYCKVTDAYGNSATSDIVTLNMKETVKPAEILDINYPDSVAEGEDFVITVTASGEDLTYEWYYKDFGASEFIRTYTFSGNTYSVQMSGARDGRQVYCKVTDAYGNSATSDIITLNMKETVKPAEILDISYPDSVAAGEDFVITVTASGEDLTYEWFYKNTYETTFAKTGAFSGNTYSVQMNGARNGRQVYCKVTDAYGYSATSDIITLTMAAPDPVKITEVSYPDSVTEGEDFVITVTASGEDLTYEWFYKNTYESTFAKTGSFSGNTYSVQMNTSRADRQVYCKVTDAYGNSETTDIITLTMAAPDPVEITEVSYPDSVAEGEDFTITVAASGDGLTYEWYYKNTYESTFAKTGAFSGNTYSVQMNTSRAGRQVYCKVIDAYGNSETTDIITLAMN